MISVYYNPLASFDGTRALSSCCKPAPLSSAPPHTYQYAALPCRRLPVVSPAITAAAALETRYCVRYRCGVRLPETTPKRPRLGRAGTKTTGGLFDSQGGGGDRLEARSRRFCLGGYGWLWRSGVGGCLRSCERRSSYRGINRRQRRQ